jgi:superfamily II DNA/RNA helicase
MSLSKLARPEQLYWDSTTLVNPTTDALVIRISELSGIKLRNWQAVAVDCLFSGNDLLVKAGTSAGKTFVFWSMIEAKENVGIVLILTPLKSIMDDHVFVLCGKMLICQIAKLKDIQVSAIKITKESLQQDPGIWSRVDRGEYRVVYATPEVLLRSRSHFMKNTVRKNTVFKKNLCTIAMDEAHTIWGYRKFRKQFRHVGKLRTLFPNVPFVALSATFPPHIVAYVQRVCNMKLDSKMITVNGRRTNIDLVVMEQHGKENIDQLLDLIPSGEFEIEDIPQTLIFVDSVIQAINLARALRRRLFARKSNCKPSTVVRTYYSTIDQEKKVETQNLVNKNRARFVICTESMSLGVDFQSIERVVQWGVDEKLTMDILSQRIGRAARDQKTQGVAIVYAPFDLLKSVNKNWKEAWANEGGEAGNTSPIPRALLSLPVSEETESMVSELKFRLYRAQEAAHETAGEGRRTDSGRARGNYRRTGIDPGVIWFLGTVGCRHRCLLSYHDYPDANDDRGQQSWCCDNCAIASGKPLTELQTAGFSPAASISLQTESQKPKPIRAERNRLLPREVEVCREEVQKNIKAWRRYLWEKLVERGIIVKELPAEVVIPNKTIEAIAKSIRQVTNPASLVRVLHTAHYRWNEGLMRRKDIEELYNVISSTLAAEREGITDLILLTCSGHTTVSS